ncbi:cation:proton antiporter regulatory subunit [Agromyces sp. MMS24-K17]|uniref:cation:proton antiporter regulatory subunit n=1 Tax=Agromyces sp. MMS24-K17 TaxID=3372850 RepID=UPI003754867F
MVEVRRVALPGVGMVHSFRTAAGVEVSVIAHRSGSSDLVVRADGADHAAQPIRLDEEEAGTLADLLGGTEIVDSISDMDALPGVPLDWFTVQAGDAIAGRALGDLAGFPGSDVTLVAVVRDQSAHPSPDDGFVVRPGDALVVVGRADAVDEAFRRARGGEEPEA